MHLNKHNIGKFWPIPRKGSKYSAVALHNKSDSIPLVVVMRDILKVIGTKKELKELLNEKQIQINYRIIKETNYPICLFDILTFVNAKKNFRATLSENKKMIFEEVSDKDAQTKIFKVIGKKILPGKKVQLNLMYGRNIISNEKINTKDSLVLDLKTNKILKIIKMEKGKNAFVIKGRHAGKKGKIDDIAIEGGKEIAKISSKGERIKVWVKNIIATE